MRITESRIRRIIREVLESSDLKKVDWSNNRSLTPEEQAVWKNAMAIFNPALKNWGVAMSSAPSKTKAERDADKASYYDAISKANAVFTSAGLEPPADLKETFASMQRMSNKQTTSAQPSVKTQTPNEKPITVAIRDDNGQLIRVPEAEALKYFQREAQKSHQRADALEAQRMAFRKEHDQKMSAGDAASASEMKKGEERHDAYTRILTRMMKEMLKYQSAGNHAGLQALGNLQQKIHQAVMDKNDVKLHEFEKAIMSWN